MGAIQNKNNVPDDEQQYVKESLKRFAHILYEYLMIKENNVE
ncbi:hypothetical protein [uncultured Aquimarina sp.]|nr:hypothetical protein [uncultured Aquimarina sp.]